MAASTGLSGWFAAAVARLIAAPTSPASTAAAGTKSAITASIPGSARTSGSARSKLSAVAEPSMSTGFATDASVGRNAARAARVSLAGRRQLEPRRLAGVGAEDPEPAGVRQHRDAPPLRDGLAREQRGDLEQTRERVGADHARLAEDGVDGGIRAGQGGRVRAGRLLPGAGAAALHREHGLLTREPAGDACELARVAERLEVEQDEIGARVVLPPLEQVVGGDVGLVADRDEGRQAEPAGFGALEEREAERARLGRESDPP